MTFSNLIIFAARLSARLRAVNLMEFRTLVISAVLAVGMVAFVGPASAKVLRVCADPDYLPYSNRAGQGFENKIADMVSKALGETVEYTWASYRGDGGFPQFL